jgi:hypothetical protein
VAGGAVPVGKTIPRYKVGGLLLLLGRQATALPPMPNHQIVCRNLRRCIVPPLLTNQRTATPHKSPEQGQRLL